MDDTKLLNHIMTIRKIIWPSIKAKVGNYSKTTKKMFDMTQRLSKMNFADTVMIVYNESTSNFDPATYGPWKITNISEHGSYTLENPHVFIHGATSALGFIEDAMRDRGRR